MPQDNREKYRRIKVCRYARSSRVFSHSVFAELLSLDDKAGAKSIVLRSRERVASFEFPDGQFDIDTREDWEKFEGGADKSANLSTLKDQLVE